MRRSTWPASAEPCARKQAACFSAHIIRIARQGRHLGAVPLCLGWVTASCCTMSATKILWGQITIVFSIVLITLWLATQWTAWRLGYQPQLGPAWFELAAGVPVYFPPAFFAWWYAYDAYAPTIFVE